jgi:hypothetical protein
VKPVRWSPHALKNLADREIPSEEAQQTLSEPEAVVAARSPRSFLMRRYFDARFQQQMLVQALVEETSEERVVITVYITSKIDKYMKGIAA